MATGGLRQLFGVLEQELERTGFQALAYGLNLDDGQDFRPGHKAAAQHRARDATRPTQVANPGFRTRRPIYS